MRVTTIGIAGALVLCAGAAQAQTYWSTSPNIDCGAYGDSAGKPMKVDAGVYVCYVYGTLPWYATGAGWGSSIRLAAPPSAPVAYLLDFGDQSGGAATLDFRFQGDATVHSGATASIALHPNQPQEVTIAGVHGGGAASGPVTVLAECPNATSCAQVQAQLILSAMPAHSWRLSTPVVWDSAASRAWSTVGVDEGSAFLAFVIYNLDAKGQAPRTYTLRVYDSAGALSATATTQAVPLYGSYGDLLRNVIPNLPAGPFKLQVVGGAPMAFEVLQFDGESATALALTAEKAPQ